MVAPVRSGLRSSPSGGLRIMWRVQSSGCLFKALLHCSLVAKALNVHADYADTFARHEHERWGPTSLGLSVSRLRAESTASPAPPAPPRPQNATTVRPYGRSPQIARPSRSTARCQASLPAPRPPPARSSHSLPAQRQFSPVLSHQAHLIVPSPVPPSFQCQLAFTGRLPRTSRPVWPNPAFLPLYGQI